jgi:hypothetical protein
MSLPTQTASSAPAPIAATAAIVTLSEWPVRGAMARVTGVVLLVLFAMYGSVILTAYAIHAEKIFADFFGFWSAARFVASHPAAEVYDRASLVLFERQMYPTVNHTLPFIYPPLFLLIVRPLGLLPYGAACMLWMLCTLALYVTALCAPVWRRPIVATLLVVPSTSIAMYFGQSGVLAAALIIGGLRLLKTRPVLAGVLLGLAAFKPQLAILLPVALVAAGCWRTIATAAVTFLAGVAASSLAFGWSIWPVWAHMLATTYPIRDVDRVRLDRMMPTVTANLQILGAPAAAVHLVQLGFALVAAAVIWRLWRRGPTRIGIAALAAWALLVTPYGFVYDMALTTGAVLLVVEEAMVTGIALAALELVVLVLALILPITMFLYTSPYPTSTLVLVALVAVILRRAALAAARRQPSAEYRQA